MVSEQSEGPTVLTASFRFLMILPWEQGGRGERGGGGEGRERGEEGEGGGEGGGRPLVIFLSIFC